MQIINNLMLKIIYNSINTQYYTYIQRDIKLNKFDKEKNKKINLNFKIPRMFAINLKK